MANVSRGIAFSVACVAAACGGGSGEADVSVDEAGSAMAAASCARSFECCTADELAQEYGDFGIESEAECAMVLGGFATAFLVPQIEAGVDAGRLVYHGDRMADCIAALEALPCGELAAAMQGAFPGDVGCADPFEGLVAAGGACASDLECASDFCDGDSMDFEGNIVEGTCSMAPPAGAACSDDFECTEGAYCDLSGGSPTCAAAQPAGGDCFSGDECASNNCTGADPMNGTPGTCSADLFCDGA